MTTIVNSPAPTSQSDNSGGLLVAIFGLMALGFLFFYYGLPAIRKMGSPQINVPSQVDINVNQTP